MALVIISGQPCSGKSSAAVCLAESLKDSDSNLTVRIIDETSFHLDRDQSYANMVAEKNVRGVLRSEECKNGCRENWELVYDQLHDY